MKASAFAKINVGLEVLYRREDGYHELRTILQTVDLADRLTFEETASGIVLSTDASELPVDGTNLVVRAAEVLARKAGVEKGARIRLEKRIPIGAGLGGGSSDAAATLVALNELWGVRLPLSVLYELARGLGADVPFFLCGGTALGVGRGDEVYPLAQELDCPVVLVLPEVKVLTAAVYGSLVLTKRESVLKLQYFASLRCDEDTYLYVINDLESATMGLSPSIEGFKKSLRELGAAAASMSGSGSAVFGLFKEEATAEAAARTLTARGARAIATRTLKRVEFLERRLDPGNI